MSKMAEQAESSFYPLLPTETLKRKWKLSETILSEFWEIVKGLQKPSDYLLN